MNISENLLKLYKKSSKHSNYQTLNDEILGALGIGKSEVGSKYEKQRFDYIIEHTEIKDKSVLDIGGNTGYFTFESIKSGCSYVDYYEGNKSHAEFVNIAKDIYDSAKVNVFSDYFAFDGEHKAYDVILCLNVVHHLGDDFSIADNMNEAKQKIKKAIQDMSSYGETLVFQMGFNWKGDREHCLFENGSKKEMEAFIEDAIDGYWEILNTGVAEKKDDTIVYCEKTEENNLRNDELGEFLNRPIFIMKSIK